VQVDDVGLPAYLLAFGGGVASFLSPCVLPLVPAYLSVVTGLDVTEIRDRRRDHTMGIARDTALFVAGFGAVFIALGLSATSFGRVVFDNQLLLTRISGVMLIIMAAFMIGSLVARAPWLYQEARFHPKLGRFGRAAPVVAGAAFGFGWTPCIGPILGSILTIAATQGRAMAGGTLLAVYALGLGVPFLVSGLAFGHLGGAFGWIKRHFPAVVVTSALSLAFFGALLVFNRLVWITTQLQELLRRLGLDWLVDIG
jgi:cytochrome c-type biogenesis protein